MVVVLGGAQEGHLHLVRVVARERVEHPSIFRMPAASAPPELTIRFRSSSQRVPAALCISMPSSTRFCRASKSFAVSSWGGAIVPVRWVEVSIETVSRWVKRFGSIGEYID